MPISEDASQLIAQEEHILGGVVASLEQQKDEKCRRFAHESTRARDLTQQFVQTRREEDKALLASDEAVAHGLTQRQQDDIKTLDQILKQPYFARMVLKEEAGTRFQEVEYKIGLAENSSCRIIDWRRAPAAKLYYEYKEGEEYSELILGRERSGTVALRNVLDTKGGLLRRIQCRFGEFMRGADGWREVRPFGISESGSQVDRGSNLLPQIAALLSPEQYELISTSGDRAMLIQGVAGSGKTTVALHRLAWLFESAPSKILSDKVVVLVLSRSLRDYISATLPALGVQNVRVLSLEEWYARLVGSFAPNLVEHEAGQPRVKRPENPAPSSVERVMRSMAVLQAIESWWQQSNRGGNEISILEAVEAVLSDFETITGLDESRLIDQEVLKCVLARWRTNAAQGVLDRCADALLVRLSELVRRDVPLFDGALGRYQHIVADEVQDFSPVDLACVVAAVDDVGHLTLVGDTEQKIETVTSFPGWEKLRRYWSFKDSISHFVRLDLSFRCTAEIQRLADHVQGRTAQRALQERHGRVPIWFKCRNEKLAIESARKWLLKAVQNYPTAMTAVICSSQAQAKQVLSYLKPSFEMGIRLGEDAYFSFDAGIVVVHPGQIRGLEFANVLLWNPNNVDYPADEHHRNLLYVAITRARDNVCIITWKHASTLLPSINSPVIRYVPVEPEIEEDPE